MWLCTSNYRVARSSRPAVSAEPAYLVWHQGGDGSSDFMIRLGFSLRAQQDKEESTDQRGTKFTRKQSPFSDLRLQVACALPGGHRDLGQGPQHDRLLQTHKRHEGVLQEVDFPDQDVWRLCISWQLFHEFILQLPGQRRHSQHIGMLIKMKCVMGLLFL